MIFCITGIPRYVRDTILYPDINFLACLGYPLLGQAGHHHGGLTILHNRNCDPILLLECLDAILAAAANDAAHVYGVQVH